MVITTKVDKRLTLEGNRAVVLHHDPGLSRPPPYAPPLPARNSSTPTTGRQASQAPSQTSQVHTRTSQSIQNESIAADSELELARFKPLPLILPVHDRHVNNISLFSRRNAIAGTYIIDTEITGVSEKKFRFFKEQPKNAAFGTRRGSINLNLSTAGNGKQSTKAFVEASTHRGNIDVNLLSLQTDKHVSMELSSRHGDIVIFIPSNFDGTIHLHSRRGNINLLPTFAQHGRIVKQTDRTMLIFFGQTESPPTQPSKDVRTDYCWASTRHGKLSIGIGGIDKLPTVMAVPSLLQKLGALLGKQSTQRITATAS